MTFRFSEFDQLVTSTESELEHSYSHLTAVPIDGRDDRRKYTPIFVAIDPSNNQIYVTEPGSTNLGRVSIYSETGQFLRKFSHPDLNYPCVIAIYCDSIYITDFRKEAVLNLKIAEDICIVACVGSRGSGIGQFNMPMRLAVSMNGDLFITDHLNDRVQILGKDLNYQRHISHNSMARPCDVKLTSEEVFVLSSYFRGPNIHVFTYTGEKLRSLTTCGHVKVQFVLSYSFCLHPNGNIIFNDYEAHQIKIFSIEGVFLHSIGEKGHQVGMFIHPIAIDLTSNLKLVVACQNYNHGLQIFSF